ncbi:MAG: hypothetical protein A3J83_03590 [Elusimicrobia bacterium RIFOXYA2_FULL_40_6]|nr:MAG: hypothetical protein A3J83_03590 [Elusimicrobia bacterium RIFOXYA2_FULL_40_6]
MSKEESKKTLIREKALEILTRPEYKTGIQWADLIKVVENELPGILKNNFPASLSTWPNEEPEKVARPYRGLFILKENLEYLEKIETKDKQQDNIPQKYLEKDLYEPAKDYLLGKGECDYAVVVGGNTFKDKWATPDVLGTIRGSSDALYKSPIELVAVEIKDPEYKPVEALGQAMAYKLFAHRTWLILPQEDNKYEAERLKGIAIINNIGLITFTGSKDDFHWEIINRPATGNPDPQEVDKILTTLKEKNKQSYLELFKQEK